MRAAGMMLIDRLERRANGLLRYDEEKIFERGGDIFTGFARVSRAVRQIIVLEQEIFGLRQPPGMRAAANGNVSIPQARSWTASERQENERDVERSDLNDLNDYNNGSIETVVACIRKSLGIEPEAPVPAPSVRRVARSETNHPVSESADRNASAASDEAMDFRSAKSARSRGPPG